MPTTNVKNGVNKIPEQMYGHFLQMGVYVFGENGCFCISDGMFRFDIPLREITEIDVINKKFFMHGWEKDLDISNEFYRDFVYERTDNMGRIWLKSVCVMHFKLQGTNSISGSRPMNSRQLRALPA